MHVTRQTVILAAALGAVIVYLLALWLAPGAGRPLIWHALVLAGGACVGVADLVLFSIIGKLRGSQK